MRFFKSLSRVIPANSGGMRPAFKLAGLIPVMSLMVFLSALMPSALVAQVAANDSVTSPAESAEPETVESIDTVNINSADAETLALALDGVGLTRALDIIAYREEYGEFKNVEQIQQVRGIGIATFARNRSKMRVTDVE